MTVDSVVDRVSGRIAEHRTGRGSGRTVLLSLGVSSRVAALQAVGLILLPLGLPLCFADGLLAVAVSVALGFLQGAAVLVVGALNLPACLRGDGLPGPSGMAANVLECVVDGVTHDGSFLCGGGRHGGHGGGLGAGRGRGSGVGGGRLRGGRRGGLGAGLGDDVGGGGGVHGR
ncbi:hypothetical protein [Curtobacterium flaccumfaciens]|uniref:hypothetical protein n=1 Tax=Curtobacterium flaccumfaciens TaxID=2035 RepID=UPI001BDE6C48|nr:hypothetical protein [Curtobacterium flaccumfaciens]MBT1671826.1 hypothetical protein [Curtobacterium flaccumfaciens pv. flaccumfaciens]